MEKKPLNTLDEIMKEIEQLRRELVRIRELLIELSASRCYPPYIDIRPTSGTRPESL